MPELNLRSEGAGRAYLTAAHSQPPDPPVILHALPLGGVVGHHRVGLMTELWPRRSDPPSGWKLDAIAQEFLKHFNFSERSWAQV